MDQDSCPRCGAAITHVKEEFTTGQLEYWFCSAGCGFTIDTPDKPAWVIAGVKVVMEEAHGEIARLLVRTMNLDRMAHCAKPCVSLDWLNAIATEKTLKQRMPGRPVMAILTVPAVESCQCMAESLAQIKQMKER